MKPLTESEMIEMLRARCLDSTQTAVAGQLGISVQMLSDILNGRRYLTARVARGMGFERVVIFRKVA